MYNRGITEPGCSSWSTGDNNKKGKNVKNEYENKGKYGKRIDVHEQVYQDRLKNYRGLLQQLRDGKHDNYVKGVEKLELEKKNESMSNSYRKETMRKTIESDFERERVSAIKFYDNRKHEITQNLITELLERKKTIENDYLTMELWVDDAEQRPAMTRKLRRRPNEPVVPVPQEKRRKPQPVPTIRYMLQDHEIEEDFKAIQQLASMASTSTAAVATVKTQNTVNSLSVKKSEFLPSPRSSLAGNLGPDGNDSSDDQESPTISDTRIEDGKLLFEKRWYHRGQPVFVDGKQLVKFSAVISAIGNETIWVKKISDNSKFRIYLSYLSKGKMSIKRRAVV